MGSKWVIFFFLLSNSLLGQIIEEDSAGEFAPDFVFTSDRGEQIRLSDFQGQVVYLSFWASWCKPCLQGFEKYHEIREELISKGVVLLNISIDKESNNWKVALERNDIDGLQGRTNAPELVETYQLYNIPRYEIIGKDGAFLYLDRSNGQSVLDNFDQFLKD